MVASCAPPTGAWPTTQACALTGNRTGNPLVCRPRLNPLSHTSPGPAPTFLVVEIAGSMPYLVPFISARRGLPGLKDKNLWSLSYLMNEWSTRRHCAHLFQMCPLASLMFVNVPRLSHALDPWECCHWDRRHSKKSGLWAGRHTQ